MQVCQVRKGQKEEKKLTWPSASSKMKAPGTTVLTTCALGLTAIVEAAAASSDATTEVRTMVLSGAQVKEEKSGENLGSRLGGPTKARVG